MNNSLRTQITLPGALRRQLDEARRITGESLSAYLQRAASERLRNEQARSRDLKDLAHQVVGVVRESSGSGWHGIDVVKWQGEQRRDRD